MNDPLLLALLAYKNISLVFNDIKIKYSIALYFQIFVLQSQSMEYPKWKEKRSLDLDVALRIYLANKEKQRSYNWYAIAIIIL